MIDGKYGTNNIIRISAPNASNDRTNEYGIVASYGQEFAEKYGATLKFCALNTTKARRLAISQKILGLPVIAVYENGEMIDSCVKDDATPENVEAMIKKYA